MRFKFTAQDIIASGKIKHNDLQEIRSWVDSMGIPEIPDEMLVLFLLSCDSQQENTKKTIKAYFKYKNAAPEIFDYQDIGSEEIQSNLSTV